MTDIFTDIALEADADGIFDLVIEDGDLKRVSGFETAIVLALFTDQRAMPDEVAAPMRRRGWDGDLYADRHEDRFGSRFWLWIEQARLTQAEQNYARLDAIDALQWMVDERLARNVDAAAIAHPGKRGMTLNIKITVADGSVVTRAWQLWNNTAPTRIEA